MKKYTILVKNRLFSGFSGKKTTVHMNTTKKGVLYE